MSWFGGKSKAPEQDDTPAVGFDDFEVRLGDLIRGERATLGKSLLDVQRELHIRATYIAAIEAGDLSAFEAPSFIAGYVRSYARYLGMDPDWCYRKFCAETNFAITPDLERTPAPLPKTRPEAAGELSQGLLSRTRLAEDPDPFWRRVDLGGLGSVAVVLALVVGLGYGGWTVLQEVQRVQLAPADQPPEVMADLDPVATGGLSGADEPQASPRNDGDDVAAQGRVRTYRPEALDAPVMVARDGPIGTIRPDDAADSDTSDPSGADGQDDMRSAIDVALSEAADTQAQSDPAQESVQVRRDGPPQVQVLAVRPSWVRVRAADGTVLFEKVLDAGERYSVPQSEDPPTLRAGNSGSVYLLVDGDPFGPTAPGAQVVDDIALTADAVTESFATADLRGDEDLRSYVDVAEAGGTTP